MNLYFKPITAENRTQAEELTLHSYQNGYIESVKECLAEADELELWRPVGIYDDSEMVGFAMYGFFPQDSPEGQVWLDRVLIDRRYQGKGYGKIAITMLLKELEKEYRKKKIYLSVYDNNERAIHLYKEIGFYFNGEHDTNGEKVMVYEKIGSGEKEMSNERMIIEKSIEIIREKTEFEPEIGLILGSGLGDYAQQIENPVVIAYEEIPGFPVSTVAGHAGQFVMGTCKGKKVIAMQGRVHYYEGYSQGMISLPVRIMKRLGIKNMVLTNAAGGVNRSFDPGTLMMIRDHINFSGSNPLMGANWDEDGPRFPDMTRVYTKELRDKLKVAADKKGIKLEEGVYMMFSGPCYETPAEVRMAGILGADAVGMSTVPEAIVCAHCGIPVIGISCITNFGAGILDQPLDHKEVVETATRVKKTFVSLLDTILEDIF